LRAALRTLLAVVALGVAVACATAPGPSATSAAPPKELKLDYAYYNPSSLVMRKFGWLEEELKAESIPVKWVLSLGSNKALEFLQSDSVDFGSTSGASAFLARANDTPIKTVYIYAKPEWTALVAPFDSPIKEIKDLRGKKVAVTKGTDPFFFLLRSLHTVGMNRNDVELVNLQHPDGKQALDRGQVDAWSGLDPHMAQTELETKARLFYRNPDFNTYGFLNAREAFVDDHPEYVRRVLKVYERARTWIVENREQAALILAEEAKITPEVARKELFERMDLESGVTPGEKHAEMLKAVHEISKAEELLKKEADGERAIRELLDGRFTGDAK
jgi:sulfonate transport system substrate-binding protein